jgi:uncharacterized protein YhbP (UPF0306 family)
MERNLTDQDILREVHEFLNRRSTVTLATVNPDGHPQAAALFFATDDQTLIFLSSAKSRHGRNVVETGRAAVTVQGETWDWRKIAGVQMEGEVALIPAGPSWEWAWQVYKAKFPFVVEFRDEASRSDFFRFTPHWLRLIDNSVEFGYHEEINLGPRDGE